MTMCFVSGNGEPYFFAAYSAAACMACGYLMIAFVSFFRISIGCCLKSKFEDPVRSNIATFMIGGGWLFGICLLCIGYWMYIHILFHCKYEDSSWSCSGGGWLIFMTGNSDLISSGLRASPYENQFKCYYVAYTIVLLGISMINLYDMAFRDAVKAVKIALRR